ncbi:MAG: proton-conducting transporter membrane subunit [Candidatus Omnitrophota bacterium]
MERIFEWPWQVPFGAFSLKFDPLSLMFLMAITILVVCAGIYGLGSMRAYQSKGRLGFHVFFYLVLALALFLIVTANNVILFLGAWEAMSMATYFLIVFHDEKSSVRRAGFLYLIMAHTGTFFLFLMFFLMSHTAGSMSFDVISRTVFPPVVAGTVFCLAIAGFGVKSGFLPVHIWLPHAHPAAPSHISALLSGVAIKAGIYGICRVIWIVGDLPDWCGYALLLLGIVSGVMGVLYALGQHELKKLLAYHSIENIGIIALGLGVGLLGRSHQMPFLAVLGFGGGLLHVVNHSLFKGLLFLGAGSVIHKVHTGEMDHLGGLAKIMPMTSTLFLIGALSICGLPLFNGFISEFIIFFGFFQGLFTLPIQGASACALGILSLALMGALALACFTKVYGTVFLGEPRVPLKNSGDFLSASGQEMTTPWMITPMVVLAGLCIWIGLAPWMMMRWAFNGGAYLSHLDASSVDLTRVLVPMDMTIGVIFIFALLMAFLALVRRLLQGDSPMPVRETWRCGFSQVSARLQYTSSSFARPIVECMKKILMARRHGVHTTEDFPGKVRLSSSVHDASEEAVFRPLMSRLIALSRAIDHSRIRYTQMYLMYIFLFLIFLMIWKLR